MITSEAFSSGPVSSYLVLTKQHWDAFCVIYYMIMLFWSCCQIRVLGTSCGNYRCHAQLDSSKSIYIWFLQVHLRAKPTAKLSIFSLPNKISKSRRCFQHERRTCSNAGNTVVRWMVSSFYSCFSITYNIVIKQDPKSSRVDENCFY